MTESLVPQEDTALERLGDNVKLLRGVVSGLEAMVVKAEGVKDDRVQQALPYLRVLWLYVSAICDLLNARRGDGRTLWNAPALAALCRPLQESFLSFYYFAIETPDPGDAEFRKLLLARHVAFKRWDLLSRSDPVSPEIARELRESKRDFDTAQKCLLEHPFISGLPAKMATNIRDKPEQFIAAPLAEVWVRAGMPKELYGVMFRYFSQYVHATPYAVFNLRFHRADHEDGAINMNVPVGFAITCAAMTLRHMGELNQELGAALPPVFFEFMGAR